MTVRNYALAGRCPRFRLAIWRVCQFVAYSATVPFLLVASPALLVGALGEFCERRAEDIERRMWMDRT